MLPWAKTTWYSASDPDAYELSQVFQLWAKNWGHVRATCESGGININKYREYGLEIGFGLKSLTLSGSMFAPPNAASITVLCEKVMIPVHGLGSK